MTKPNSHQNWQQANIAKLAAEIAAIRRRLQHFVDETEDKTLTDEKTNPDETAGIASHLDRVCHLFDLTIFERQLLLLCAGVELDVEITRLCSMIYGDKRTIHPQLQLALNILDEPHLSALAPQSALRRWQLIEFNEEGPLSTRPLRIPESLLHHLLGTHAIDSRLNSILIPIRNTSHLTDSQKELVEQIIQHWRQASKAPTLLHLTGKDHASYCSIVKAACQQWPTFGLQLVTQNLPQHYQELDLVQRLLEREALLHNSVYLIEHEMVPVEKQSIISHLVEQWPSYFILAGRELPSWIRYPLTQLPVVSPNAQEQIKIWQALLRPELQPEPTVLENLASHFNFNPSQIQKIADSFNHQTELSSEISSKQLWQRCKEQSHQRVEELVQVMHPKAEWEDIQLPDMQMQILKDIVNHVSQRHKVYHRWGFAKKSSRGLGVCALFAGPSGTGKTLSAEVIAHALELDLYHIDLSMVISKYIGETEKNLKKVFDCAEQSGAVLLFDEADALFGKRSEVKDSHDRYANIETSYLLQRIEAYPGLSILTTNQKNALDDAFLRRIRFIVPFPFPDHAQRAQIWQHIYPASTPVDHLDVNKLANLNIAGGDIRNIALHAAFIAAENDGPVTMQCLLRAAQNEYLKLERTLSKVEIKDWV